MKKLLLIFAVVGASFMSGAQVICAVQSPGNIAGNYGFSWADPANGDWSTPDFLIPGTWVEDTLMLSNDGVPGLNAQGNPVSASGCNPLTPGSLEGKIAVVFRGDGTTNPVNQSGACEFGAKALNAQNAGAVAVIIINREQGVIAMGGGADGTNVTIPVIMISLNDGLILLNEMANGPVVALIGNKTGLFPNDAGITPGATLISKSYGVPSQLAQNASEFNFELGTRVYNYGTGAQNNVSVTANVNGPSGTSVYNNTVNVGTLISGDSVDIYPGGAFSFPQFSLPTYAPGRYSLSYTVNLSGVSDDYDADNTVSSDFVVNDSIFSYAMLDEVTGLPVANNGYRPSTNDVSFSTCMVIDNPNASRVGVKGIYFSASTGANSGVELVGEEIRLYLYRWDNVFIDLNDTANLAFNDLTEVAFGFYYYPADLQGETVYGAFDTPVLLEDNQRYLACAQTLNLEVYLGHDTKTNYLWNEGFYLQPLTPNESDGTFFASGFGMDVPSAMGLAIFNAAELGVDEVSTTVNGKAFPNPATNDVTISIEGEGTAQVVVTDLAGKVVMNSGVNLVNGNADLSVSTLDAGMYVFNVTLENGKTAQFNVVKK
jgi:hypothetical protein